MTVKIASTAVGSTWMLGDITAYDSSTGALVVTVTSISDSGTLADWTVSQSAPGGAKVGVNADITSLTGLTTALSVAQGGTGLTSVPHTVRRFTSGSGTYTLPTNCKAIKVTMVGGGGGGSGGGTATMGAGGAGGNTTFGTNISYGGAGGGIAYSGSASGGSYNSALGAPLIALIGGSSLAASTFYTTIGTIGAGSTGGSSILGGSTGAGGSYVGSGGTGQANSGGGGGGGGGGTSATLTYNGVGGGAGGGIICLITSPSATYAYSIGAGGTAGAAGAGANAVAGGAGGSGIIIVEEYYV